VQVDASYQDVRNQQPSRIVWNVTLTTDSHYSSVNGYKWGFEVSSCREEFCRRLGIDAGPEVLMIANILALGPLAVWNDNYPDMAVKEGDHILEVNDAQFADDMLRELCLPCIRLRIARFPQVFQVSLHKRGGAFGCNFRQPASDTVRELLITDILPNGALSRHNEEKAAHGRWDLVVLPNMSITAVNGQADPQDMTEVLCQCESVDLCVQRSSLGPLVPAKVALRVLEALRPLPSDSVPSSYKAAVESAICPLPAALSDLNFERQASIAEEAQAEINESSRTMPSVMVHGLQEKETSSESWKVVLQREPTSDMRIAGWGFEVAVGGEKDTVKTGQDNLPTLLFLSDIAETVEPVFLGEIVAC